MRQKFIEHIIELETKRSILDEELQLFYEKIREMGDSRFFSAGEGNCEACNAKTHGFKYLGVGGILIYLCEEHRHNVSAIFLEERK